MPRKIAGVETNQVTIRLPNGLIDKMDKLLKDEGSIYASRTDIVLTALREFLIRENNKT